MGPHWVTIRLRLGCPNGSTIRGGVLLHYIAGEEIPALYLERVRPPHSHREQRWGVNAPFPFNPYLMLMTGGDSKVTSHRALRAPPGATRLDSWAALRGEAPRGGRPVRPR